MSYAIRNSLILLIVLLLFAGGGWGYIHYYQTKKLEKLDKQVISRKNTLHQYQQIADQYQTISDSYQRASAYFNNYKKALFLSSDEDRVFDFLTTLNYGAAHNDFTFAFTDSTTHPNYGVLNMHIEGIGSYRNVVNFIRGIELSKPLNKIKQLNITAEDNDSTFGKVSYSFNLKSYYYRSKILEQPNFNVSKKLYASLYNPFFPLIHDVRPNKDHRVNVEKSKLVAISADRVFLIDQSGVLQQIKIGQRVYLGKLSGINLRKRTATFVLNKGGITKSITLNTHDKYE